MATESSAGSAIDEAAAWALMLQARKVCPAGGARVLAVAENPALELHVDDSGEWRTAALVNAAAARLLDIYTPLCVTAGPAMVMAQMGQSVDGRIATVSGHSHYITGSEDIVHLHRLRALCDAVVIGAGTAAADNPRLTVRHVPGPSPVRVLIDPALRAGGELHLVTDGAAPTLVLFDPRRAGSPPADGVGVEWLPVAAGEHGLAPEAVLELLTARGLHRVLVEGGGETVSRFLRAGVLDRLHVTIAPLIIGSGRPGLTLPPVDSLEQACRPASRHFSMGDDVLFDLRLS